LDYLFSAGFLSRLVLEYDSSDGHSKVLTLSMEDIHYLYSLICHEAAEEFVIASFLYAGSHMPVS